VVHLHGYATLDEASPDLIFSILEYVQATSTRYAWHRVLGDMFLQRPFIV